MEGCSAPDFAFSPDPAFMRFNDMSGNCQAQTGSMLSFSLLILALIEVFENILDLYCRNTGAIVRDSYFNCVGLPVDRSAQQGPPPESRLLPEKTSKHCSKDYPGPVESCARLP